ncbi:phosphoglycerate mutase [Bacillus sp. FJAT-27225]|uniref:histidine phosphatase family protein n=1 Tax=Bacillus sp. FJAT-27225 TaxID=1743144 RepID=UPI00080C2FC0|nr:histidine phosphatase family protein [Bacillus sp. FJAT-27225]OCA90558.1 phosphoglycerate mutase [Bacillus sp. FJAT-27225]
MELLLIRHGQSEADLLGVHEGRADFPLTELGLEQAAKLADYVSSNLKPDIIVASPLKRALQTAAILQEAIGCKLHVDETLMEWNNGVLAGLPYEVAATRYPLPKEGRPPYVPIEGGESDLEFRFRAEAFLQKVIHEHADAERVAIVSHGGMISNLIQAYLKLPAVNEFIFPTGDTGFHRLEERNGNKVVRMLNSQVHLL